MDDLTNVLQPQHQDLASRSRGAAAHFVALKDLQWVETTIRLRIRIDLTGQKAVLLDRIFAMCKSVPWPKRDPAPYVNYRVLGVCPVKHQPSLGEELSVKFTVVGATDMQLGFWLDKFSAAVNLQGNFVVLDAAPWRRCNVETALAEYLPEIDPDAEVWELALVFESPFSLKKQTETKKGMHYAPLSDPAWGPGTPARHGGATATRCKLLDALAHHLRSCYVAQIDELAPASTGQGIRVIDAGLALQSWCRTSWSGGRTADAPAGHAVPLGGWMGRLVLQGNLRPWLPWLAAAQALGGGIYAKNNGFGSLRLQYPPPALFDAKLLDRELAGAAFLEACSQTRAGVFETQQAQQALQQALADIECLTFKAEPTQAMSIAKTRGGGRRTIESLSLRDRALVAHVRQIVEPGIECLLSDHCFAYRKGRSVEGALGAARACMAAGHRWALKTDIAEFFPTIRHEVLFDMLDMLMPQADVRVRHVLLELVCAPRNVNGQLEPRTRGLAQGSGLSPMLANLYLHRLDTSLQALGAHLVRYGDDLLVLGKSKQTLDLVLAHMQAALSQIGLTLAADKTSVVSLQSNPLEFLGQMLRIEPDGSVAGPVRVPDKKALVLATPGRYLQLMGDAVEIREKGALLQTLPIRMLSCVVSLTFSSFSQPLLERLARQGIAVVLKSPGNRYACALALGNGSTLRAWAQHAAAHALLARQECLDIAKAWIGAKLFNKATLIAGAHQAGRRETLARLRRAITNAEQAQSHDELRGIEGYAASLAFKEMRACLVDQRLANSFTSRDRKNPDKVNQLLNFGYTLLALRLHALLLGAGLNPYLGCLHEDKEPGYPTLAFDLCEPFRAHVDRFVVRYCNKSTRLHSGWRELDAPAADAATASSPSVALIPRMTTELSKHFAAAFEDMLHERIGRQPLAEWLEVQVQSYKARLLTGSRLWVFHVDVAA